VREGLLDIFHEEHRQLRPGTAPPELKIEFFAFANVNNTIRLREGRLLVRLSDLLEGAPDGVVRAIAHILLAKMYRKPIDRSHAARYRKYIGSHEVVNKGAPGAADAGTEAAAFSARALLRSRHDFEDLNRQFFHGLLGRRG